MSTKGMAAESDSLTTVSRRSFIHALGAGLAIANIPRALSQQSSGIRRIAWYGGRNTPGLWVDTVRARLDELGFVEARDVELRLFDVLDAPEGAGVRPPGMEAVLAWRPHLILADSSDALRSAIQATSSIPIVFTNVADPVGLAMVDSLRRPGRNVTGATTHYVSLAGKRLELTRELLPKARKVALLFDSIYVQATPGLMGALDAIGRRLSLELVKVILERRPNALPAMIQGLDQSRADAALTLSRLVVYGDDKGQGLIKALLDFQARLRTPWIDDTLESVEHGFFMALGEAGIDRYRRLAEIAARVLKGAMPGTLPVDEPTRVQIWVNQRAARSIGIEIPPSILVRADRIIQ